MAHYAPSHLDLHSLQRYFFVSVRKENKNRMPNNVDPDEMVHKMRWFAKVLVLDYKAEVLFRIGERKKHSRLSLSRSPRDSLKYFEISVSRHIRFAELMKKDNSNNHISQMNM